MPKRRAADAEPAGDRIPEAAAHARIRDLEGGEHELRELWAERPVVLVFVRHFG
jgi:hypothetical protein